MSKNINFRKNNTSTELSIFKAFMFSVFIGIFIFVAFLALFSVLILNVYVDKNYLFIFVLASSGISAFVCSITVCKFFAQKKLIFSTILAVILSISEFLIILCFNNASLSNFVYLLFPVDIISGFVGCVTGINIKKDKKFSGVKKFDC